MKWLSLVPLSIMALIAAPAAWAVPITLTTHLTGPAENPTNNSPGIGDATVTFDSATHIMTLDVTFSGLTGTTTASHIHCCITVPGGTAMVATQTPTFVNFPLGVTSGTYSNSFDMSLASSYNPAFVTANGTVASAEQAFFDGLLAGTTYLNIHSTVFPGGEIRGFLVAVPEPATIGMLGLGLVSLLFIRRQSRG